MASKLKPTGLKSTLFVILFIVIIGTIVGFYFARIQIAQFAEGSNNVPTADNSNKTTRSMVAELNSYIQTHQTTVDDSSAKVFASSLDYEKQITAAVNAAASTAGINITKSVYGKPVSVTELPVIAEGITAGYVTLTISTPTSYNNVIKFLQSVENSSPKMQILDLSISPSKSGVGQVTISPIIIGFYIK